MSDKENIILIVDPLVSTEYSVKIFRKYGFKVFAFWTKEIDIPYFKNSITADLFYKSLLSTQDFEKDVRLINNELGNTDVISLVICGTDSSVAYSDRLNNYFCPDLENNYKTSFLRFDKFQMIQALKNAGLPAQNQSYIDNIEEFDIDEYTYPIIVKPTAYSSSSYGVRKCFNKDESVKQIREILLQDSVYGHKTTALIQEYISGDEYAINTVSYKGKHHLISVSKYSKNVQNGQFLYKFQEIVNDPSLLSFIEEYVSKVLDILDVKTGFAHTEIKVQDGIPYLIELNPRFSGASGCFNYMEKESCGTSQQEALCRLLLNLPVDVKQTEGSYALYFLNNFNICYDQLDLKDIRALPSYLNSKVIKDQDLDINETKDFSLNDTACYIILKNTNFDYLSKDISNIDILVRENKVFRISESN
ncbi:ATP-grasp domain-containing protein [Francisella sp. 19X1-34]|uniref:ATP-grasp domain-containing protein n=1 Tax=Francisella sp. 19X1-34 TaxID=3087177 RepID=UPI002E352277|nr:ATP-grasp domain-containing protein [Francisella sp. 19X1-34]MED7788451.1 ATP-grasp domain-containing protein [Francisella sp. 19X1-34]